MNGADERPRRLAIVAHTTVEFDSRTRKIAAGVAERGHDVSIIGRWEPGLPFDETLGTRVRVIRPAVSWRGGLPLVGPGFARRELRRARRQAQDGATPSAANGGGARSTTGDSGPGPTHRAGGAMMGSRGAGGRFVRLAREARRVAVSVLLVRAHGNAALELDPGADLYHGMAFMGYPVALRLAGRRRVPSIYDVRDIYLDSTNLARYPGPIRRILARRERSWAHRADALLTVNDACADLLEARFGGPRPEVVLNAGPRREVPSPPPRRFHERLRLDPATRVVLYQGGFVPDRGIDVLMDAIALVPNAVLVLLGYGPMRQALEERAASPGAGGRIRVLPAVPPEDLPDWVASADVGAMPSQAGTLNQRLSTPNKLFESLAVGLPVVSSDFPVRRRIIIDDPDGPLGAVCDPSDPAAVAAAIRSILDLDPVARDDLRARCLAAAHARYSWEPQMERVLSTYTRITGLPW